MNRNHKLFWFATALALLGTASVGSAQDTNVEGKAIVRAAHGRAEYSKGSQWLDAKPNKVFPPGTTLRAGRKSFVDLFVNGTSTIRVTAETTLQFQKMTHTSNDLRNADTETILDLKSGTILGNVKKLPANSRYEITTPHGVAGIRGTDYEVSVRPQTNGEPVVTFTSVTGELVCSAVVNGQTVVKVLRTGEMWRVGDKDIKLAPPNLIQAAASSINTPPVPPNR